MAGNLFVRDEGHDMVAAADEVVAILREACRAAEDMGMKIAMENHADFTVRELASIHARVNSPAFGFTVDCANLAFDLDDPLRLAEILAPHALTTHFKNYRIVRTGEGLALENCALGRRRDRLARHRRDAGEIQSADQPEYRNPLAIRPVQAQHAEPGLLGETPCAVRPTVFLVLGESLGKPPLEPWPDNLPDGPAAWKREAEDLRSSVRLGAARAGAFTDS